MDNVSYRIVSVVIGWFAGGYERAAGPLHLRLYQMYLPVVKKFFVTDLLQMGNNIQNGASSPV